MCSPLQFPFSLAPPSPISLGESVAASISLAGHKLTPIVNMALLSKSPAAAAKVFVSLLLLLLSVDALAENVGVVSHLLGTLSVERIDGSHALLATQSEVNQGDLLTTEKGTFARVKFNDHSEVVLRPATQLKVQNFNFIDLKPEQDSAVLNLIKGGLRKVTGLIGKRNQPMEQFNTPVATIGIRGTHYGLLFCQNDCRNIPTVTGRVLADGLHIDVAKGLIFVQNQAGSLLVKEGQFAYVKDAKTAPVLVDTEDGVQVTIPPTILDNNSDGAHIDTHNSDETCLIN